MSEIAPAQILDLPMQGNDSGADTVRGYLTALLLTLWKEGERFSGRRPFGNSAWEYDLYEALGRAGLIEMTFDENGYMDVFTAEDEVRANKLVIEAIKSLGVTQ